MSNVLNDLKNLTVISKKLSEAHVKTLTKFCFIALENINKVEIEYCIDPNVTEYSEKQDLKGYVKFTVFKKNSKKKMGNKSRNELDRFKDIKKWTESIFWKNIDISFFDKKGKRLDVERVVRNKKISS